LAGSKLNAEAVKRLGAWVDGARPNESAGTRLARTAFGLARAQWALAQDLKSANPKDPQIKRNESEARKNAQFVSRITGDLQQEARQFLAQIGVETASRRRTIPRRSTRPGSWAATRWIRCRRPPCW
jgi:hypothetical protein